MFLENKQKVMFFHRLLFHCQVQLIIHRCICLLSDYTNGFILALTNLELSSTMFSSRMWNYWRSGLFIYSHILFYILLCYGPPMSYVLNKI